MVDRERLLFRDAGNLFKMAQRLQSVAMKTKYPLEAFIFVRNGLDFTVRSIHGDPEKAGSNANRHISGQQLCYGLRDYAVEQYGLLARTVLQRWSIHCSEDFGHIVFAMVDAGEMAKTDDDTLENFAGVYDFSEAFSPTLSLK